MKEAEKPKVPGDEEERANPRAPELGGSNRAQDLLKTSFSRRDVKVNRNRKRRLLLISHWWSGEEAGVIWVVIQDR